MLKAKITGAARKVARWSRSLEEWAPELAGVPTHFHMPLRVLGTGNGERLRAMASMEAEQSARENYDGSDRRRGCVV